MSVYGNFITESQVNPVNKVKESLCEIESVVYNEYCNYKSLLESCTDDNERAVLEAKVEVLQEVSFKDIIGKIKELWAKFKQWVKDLFNKIFRNKDKIQKENKEAIRKAEQAVNKAKSEGITESVYLESDDEDSVRKPSMELNIYYVCEREKYKNQIHVINDKIGSLKYKINATENEINNYINILKSGNNAKILDLLDKENFYFDTYLPDYQIKSEDDGERYFSYSDLLDDIKKYSDTFSNSINNISSFNKELTNNISKLERELTDSRILLKVEDLTNPKLISLYSRINNEAISAYKNILSYTTNLYNQLLKALQYYTNKAKQIDDYFEYRLNSL